MNHEYELVQHPEFKYVNLLLVDMGYRSSHFHTEIELCVILEGDTIVYSNRETYQLKPGDFILFNANEPHEFKAVGPKNRILTLQISGRFCETYYPGFGQVTFDAAYLGDRMEASAYSALCHSVRALMVEMAYYYLNRLPESPFKMMSAINTLFAELMLHVPYHILTDEERISQKLRVDRLNRIIDYVRDHYMHKIRLSDIAERENLTMTYLSHFFKDHLNRTFQDYVHELRLEHAKRLLADSDKRLIDICVECGFSDNRYLYKAFRQKYGCTPNEYRAMYDVAPELRLFVPEHSTVKLLSADDARVVVGKLFADINK